MSPLTAKIGFKNENRSSELPEEYKLTIQNLVDSLGYKGCLSWFCEFSLDEDFTPSLIMSGSGSLHCVLTNIKPVRLYINPSNLPIIDLVNSNKLVRFDFSQMSIVDTFTKDVQFKDLPSILDIDNFLKKATESIENKKRTENHIKNLVKDYLMGMCAMSAKTATESANKYYENISEEQRANFPTSEHGAIFKISSDWSRNRKFFG